jgi:hypothetical protein
MLHVWCWQAPDPPWGAVNGTYTHSGTTPDGRATYAQVNSGACQPGRRATNTCVNVDALYAADCAPRLTFALSTANHLYWDAEEKAWSIGSAVGGEEVCAFNEDDVKTVDKIRMRWQVCDGTSEDFTDHRSMRLKALA